VKSFGRTLLLQDDPQKIALYKRYHQTVWPEVLESIRRSGVNGMWIFLLGRRMFMYMTTTDDYDAARAGAVYLASPRVQEWEDLMRTLQERAPEARPDEWWAEMELVFSMDWPQHRSPTR
jgi:L-rhamnose mutarotase